MQAATSADSDRGRPSIPGVTLSPILTALAAAIAVRRLGSLFVTAQVDSSQSW
jgi:hypothetical protein